MSNHPVLLAAGINDPSVPWLAGMALTAGFGYPAVPWIGAGLAVIALALLAGDAALARAEHPGPRPPALVSCRT